MLFRVVLIALCLLPLVSRFALACTNPAGTVGSIAYTTTNTFVGCTPAGWTAFHAPPYIPNGVYFNGVSAKMAASAPLTGVSNTDKATGSIWVKGVGSSGAGLIVITGSVTNFNFINSSSSRFTVTGANSSGTTVISMRTTGVNFTDGSWHHIVFSFDLSDPTQAKSHMYVDGSSNKTMIAWISGEIIDLTTGRYSVGGIGTNTYYEFGTADLWLDFGNYIDLSLQANRRKFSDQNQRPVNLGVDGSLPTGTPPDIFFSGATASWPVNKGNGGGFTLSGALSGTSGPEVGCTLPTGTFGSITYDSNTHTFVGCTPAGWTAFHTAVAGSSGCAGPAGNPGEIMYDSNTNRFVGCTPAGWTAFGR